MRSPQRGMKDNHKHARFCNLVLKPSEKTGAQTRIALGAAPTVVPRRGSIGGIFFVRAWTSSLLARDQPLQRDD